MRVLVVLLALALAGCGTAGKPRIKTVEVRVPVPTKCTPDIGPKPTYATETADLSADLFELVKVLLIERDQRTAREAELQAAVDACR